MTDEHWETELLDQATYYKKVLLDGCIIQKYDVEMCDLRFFYRARYRNNSKPRIQIYKANKGSKEVIEEYHNYDESFSKFSSLIKKR